MASDMIPRSPGYSSVGSRRYAEWQTLAFEATTGLVEEFVEDYAEPLVYHHIYKKPTRILSRPPTEAEAETEISRKSMPQPGQEMTNGSKSRDQFADGSHLTKED